jgi:hypothetical protein
MEVLQLTYFSHVLDSTNADAWSQQLSPITHSLFHACLFLCGPSYIINFLFVFVLIRKNAYDEIETSRSQERTMTLSHMYPCMCLCYWNWISGWPLSFRDLLFVVWSYVRNIAFPLTCVQLGVGSNCIILLWGLHHSVLRLNVFYKYLYHLIVSSNCIIWFFSNSRVHFCP